VTQRSNERKAVGLLVKLTYSGVDEFTQRYATNLSDGGMFVRTREPQPVGTELHFRVELANGQRVLQGLATVRWVRGANDPAGPAGMGLQFRSLDEASRVLVERMLASAAPPPPPPPPNGPSLPGRDPFAPLAATEPPAAPAPPPPPPSGPSLPGGDPFAPYAATEPPPPVPTQTLPPKGREPPAAEVEPSAAFAPSAPVSEPVPSSLPSIEIDVDALVAAAPPPREEVPPPFQSSPSAGFDIDLDLAAAPPPPPAPPPTAAAPPSTPKAPVLTQARAEAPPPPPDADSKPVFLVDEGPPANTGPVIGIDLGTTNSACAVLNKGRPAILNSKDGYNTIPSVVALSKTGKLEIGRRAKAQLVINPKLAIFGAKRLVGREFDSPTVKVVRERSHFAIVRDARNRPAVRLGEHTLTLEEVQGLVLRECREMAEQALGTKVSRAVVTCPAYYSEAQREAVRRAGRLAGLKVERVLNEPTAAALAFGISRELTRTVLVYDLGGGTFDATLLKIDKSVFEVLATGGDVFLGGVDFDNQIVDLMIERFQQQHGRPFQGSDVALARLSDTAEKAKMSLSEQGSFEVLLPMLDMDLTGRWFELKCTLTRAEIEKACGPLVDRTIHAVQDVLLDAKLKPSQVDDIILVGGMSRMPLVREKLKALFKKPAHASVNADEAVALGAAIYSGSVDKVSSLVLIDVVPMTVGLGKPGGGFHRLIERNTPLPVTKTFGLSTFKDNQTELEVLVFQGEDNNVSGNEFLGAVKIDGLPKAPKGAVQIAITLTLDAECVIHVEAQEFRTRKKVKATMATRYTTEEVAQRLGISAEKQAQASAQRDAELTQRAGGFWSRLKKAFGKA
jgi:uncharacterized protein (TIGR02266 family)